MDNVAALKTLWTLYILYSNCVGFHLHQLPSVYPSLPLFSSQSIFICHCPSGLPHVPPPEPHCEFGRQARLVSAGKPLLFIWLCNLRAVNTMGQIPDDMWKRSVVKTLEKTRLHQSLRISVTESIDEGKMDSRRGVNGRVLGCLVLAIHRKINCPLWGHFMLICPSSLGT